MKIELKVQVSDTTMLSKITKARFIKIILLIYLIVPIASVAKAQDTNPIEKSTLVTSFPFKLLSGGIIILEVRLESFPDTLNFILDTGSGGISLDSATVSYFKLPITPSERILRGIGTLRKVNYVTNKTLHLPKLDIEHLDFHINDYDLLTSVYGVKIDGIMGQSFLSRYIVKIDYDRSTIEVWTRGIIKYPKRGIILQPEINGIPVFNASIADGRGCNSRFYFDTGAGLCILMSQDFEKDSSILQKGKKIIETQAEGLGGKEPMKLSTVKEIRIGKYKFKKVPAHIFKDEYNVTAYPYLGGLIGNDLLRRFNLIINYGQKEIHLAPNTHFREPFDYSYTGLGVYLVNGYVTIEDVMQNSPGEKAGLKPGDIIVAIDNSVNANIQTYKNLLQTPGAKLRVLVSRNGELVVTHIKVASIL